MSNIVQFSAFSNKKNNASSPATQLSPKELREQAALEQENHCYFCGTHKDSKDLHWLIKVGFKPKTHVICNACTSDAKSNSMDDLRIILALKAMNFKTIKLKQYLELRENGVQIEGIREYKFYFETV
ncbi:hypothetical protein [Photobacterium damselae]|uniref:Uncharacterized protein n=1 Tax=Photobacterium damselae TaxID=38293 RepID=A0A2T3QEU2_PHODM|nr:hypothetical protein [Photobacterium damselae]PSW82744.1 hypothetical protein CTN07_17755 [Photobacterium damselae]SPY44472.1 Uncharacterised protein [Photobacterium damselae]